MGCSFHLDDMSPQPSARRRPPRSSSTLSQLNHPLLFTPSYPPIVLPPKKSHSSPNLPPFFPDSHFYLPSFPRDMFDADSDDDLDSPVMFAVNPANPRIRHPYTDRFPPEDEPSNPLPTARIFPSPVPIAPPSPFARLTPLLFQTFRLLSIIPAFFGTIDLLFNFCYPPSSANPNTRVDYIVSALWAILTGYQCLCLATGLLTRWQAYYSPLPTLVRLLALQAICWPATHLTLTVLNHRKRPLVCWALIASTTCFSRSIQLWVTSNLWDHTKALEKVGAANGSTWGTSGKWAGRRWDWAEVGRQCALPAGVLYFITAWAAILRREWDGC